MQGKNKVLYAILLAGGEGSRFWPQSRTLEPKQFLSLHKGDSLFVQSIKRIKALIPAKNIFVVTSDLYRSQIIEHTSVFSIPAENIICEPTPKNTAPAIGLAVRLISLGDAQALVCVLPCDHIINNKTGFLKMLTRAFNLCDTNLVVFGIPPSRPATGYGYIKVKGIGRDKEEKKSKTENVYRVEKFLEKPDLPTAERLIKERRHFWNSGIFVGQCSVFLEEIKKHLPLLYQQLLKLNQWSDIQRIWKALPAISFDYGVLENSKRLLMLKAEGLGWSDLGSWQAWDETLKKDRQGNVLLADAINLGSSNITLLGKQHLIATIGLKDLIIVDTADALLITKKDRSEEVKKVVEILKRQKRREHYLHRTVRRPWGNYTVLDTGKGFKIKLVEVKPRHSLSLQFHQRRSEHWVVVEGRAKILRGKKSYWVNSNESTFIPVGAAHRLINPTDSTLKLVEVQAGDYLEEDDIVRLKDDFGRS